MKKFLGLFILACLFLTGCDDGKIKVKFDCNGITKEYKVKKGSTFKCNLFSVDYKMKIIELTNDKFVIESDNPLSLIDEKGRVIDSNSTQTIFDIPKGEKTKIAVPLDGLVYTVEFEW